MRDICVSCEYDLTGLPADRSCPECGMDRSVLAVRSRMKGTASALATGVTLIAQLAGIFCAFIIFRVLMGSINNAFGAYGAIISMAFFLASLVLIQIVLPKIVCRFLHPGGMWDEVMVINEDRLTFQDSITRNTRQEWPWDKFLGVEMKRKRRGESELRFLFPLSAVKASFRLTFIIDADGELAQRVCETIKERIEASATG